ncbi:type VI secretion system accessory protein TagJ [Burkholderia diffusa]|uniref:type VI secretion system accessory protein TagJ n=1 Tax=Burkholderia diffusa TaxID=488732 RepID=UPI000753032D|nr:type VI secretion system accessory protein TagJ [Burkholderia diffusa]AOI61255.1 ImpE/SciE family protein [Burkholderia diffusa]KVC44724.1 ImpE/SciE family protein [Burkholderia diffusa]
MTRSTAAEVLPAHRLSQAPLDEQIARTEARVRAQPTTPPHRWALFQSMCVTGQWARAIQQLQVWGRLVPDQAQTAQVFRDLIRAERHRARVVHGRARPGFVFDPPPWIDGLLGALRAAAEGQLEVADGLRSAAFDAAPDVATSIPDGTAAWIVDSDSRLGPVCEFISAGHYRWVPIADLAGWRVSTPTTLVDLVWAPCTLTLVDGNTLHGFMPARYPGSEAGSDAVRVGRETVWRHEGRTAAIALGQKTWMTEQGDFSLFELADATFGSHVARHATDRKQLDD